MPNDILLPLLSRQGQTVIKLAKLLLSNQPGDRLERIQDYAEKFDVGVGTIQAALNYIQEVGAIRLDTRGHLGTYIREMDYPLLWGINGQDAMVGGMPLPYSRRYEGLATGLQEAFNRAGVGLNLVFGRGAMNRLRTLRSGRCDFVVLSRFAFNNAVELGLDIEEVLGLGNESYVGQHVIFLRDHSKSGIEDGMRIGIDPQSIDQVYLTKEACRGKDVQFLEISYMNLAAALEREQIDATVWNSDDFTTPSSPFKTIPFPHLENFAAAQENTEAVIVIKKDNSHILQMLRLTLDRELIRDIQKQVMEKKRLPTY